MRFGTLRSERVEGGERGIMREEDGERHEWKSGEEIKSEGEREREKRKREDEKRRREREERRIKDRQMKGMMEREGTKSGEKVSERWRETK